MPRRERVGGRLEYVMHKPQTSIESIFDVVNALLDEAEVARLSRLRTRCIERFGRVVGRYQVAEQFDHFFWGSPETVEHWRDLNEVGRARRIRQFRKAMEYQSQRINRRTEMEARLLGLDAVNDDVARLQKVPRMPDVGDKVSVEGFLIRKQRPQNRADCPDYRPCPYVSCRYHLYLDVTRRGRLRINFPKHSVTELESTCSLDLAADGPKTLEQIGEIMGGISRERVRQIEQAALIALREQGDIALADFLSSSFEGEGD